MNAPVERRVERWLSHPAAQWIPIVAGVVVALPSIGLGFFADDDAILAFLEKRFPFSPPWYDLYRFSPGNRAETVALIEAGGFPWWTAPGLRLHLVRPLSSALLALDHAVFGSSPIGYHLHSIAWWVLLLFAVRSLYRRILPGQTGALALLLFAVANTHVHPFAWISARHALVAAVPAVFGLVAAVRAREEGWAPGRWLAALAMIVGLAGGEVALGGLAFWLSYEVFGPLRPAAWRDRLLLAALPIAIVLGYLVVYAAARGGARESGGYVDPSTPVAFAIAAAVRYPALLACALVNVPADLAAVYSAIPFVLSAVFGAVLATLLWRASARFVSEPERAALRWLLPGALLAMLGAVGGFPGSRLLLVPDLAWALLFAILIRYGFRAGGSAAFLRRAGTGLEVLLHLVLPPLVILGLTANASHTAEAVRRLAHDPAYAAGPPDRHVFAAQASDPMTFLYPLALIAREGNTDPRACFSLLSGAKVDVRITRTGRSTMTVEPLTGSLLHGPFQTLYRSPDAGFRVGDEVRTCGARVRVLAVDDEAKPTRIELSVDGALDDSNVRVVAWQGGALRTLHLAVGERLDIPWSPGPMGMF